MRRGWKLYTFKRHSDPKHPAQLDAKELGSRLEELDGENQRFYITHTHCVHMMPGVDEHPPVCCQTPRVEGAALAEIDAYFETSVLRNKLLCFSFLSFLQHYKTMVPARKTNCYANSFNASAIRLLNA